MERPFLERPPQDAEWQPVSTLERHAASGRRAFDAGDRLETLDAITHQLLDPGSLEVLRTGQRHAHRQDTARVVPGVHIPQRDERPDEKRGANQ